jgi:hypothetical protein
VAGKKRTSGHRRRDATAADSAGRVIVTYRDGTWTDNLAVERYAVEPTARELVLTIEVIARERAGKVREAREALRDFVAKVGRIDTIQIGKPLFVARVRGAVRGLEQATIGVRLSAPGAAAVYPAGVAIDPDAVTLNLG